MEKLFLDSGAHSLYMQNIRKSNDRTYSFFDSEEFWEYVDNYCKFVLKYKDYFDVYVNVDIIFNPVKSVELQKYIENKFGLKPLPVLHPGEDPKYLDIYLNDEYEYVGFGGLGQEMTKGRYITWADNLFKNKICDEDGIPKIKVHGFAVTSHELLMRYPWYSVDATSWRIRSAYGLINIPHFENGKFDYTIKETNLAISTKQPKINNFDCHYQNLTQEKREIIDEYIKLMGFKVGSSVFEGDKEIIIEKGLCNTIDLRTEFNARYYEILQDYIPKEFKYINRGLLWE